MVTTNPASQAVSLLKWMATQLVDRNPSLAQTCFDTAVDLEQFDRLAAALREPGTCQRCGGPIVNAARGRRRTYCRTCRPASTAVDREMTEKFAASKGSKYEQDT